MSNPLDFIVEFVKMAYPFSLENQIVDTLLTKSGYQNIVGASLGYIIDSNDAEIPRSKYSAALENLVRWKRLDLINKSVRENLEVHPDPNLRLYKLTPKSAKKGAQIYFADVKLDSDLALGLCRSNDYYLQYNRGNLPLILYQTKDKWMKTEDKWKGLGFSGFRASISVSPLDITCHFLRCGIIYSLHVDKLEGGSRKLYEALTSNLKGKKVVSGQTEVFNVY